MTDTFCFANVTFEGMQITVIQNDADFLSEF